MNQALFLYGTLCDPQLFQIVGGAALSGRSAVLEGHRSVWAKGESFPLIVEDAGATAEGLLVEVDDETKMRLDFYELGFHYNLRPVTARVAHDQIPALVYFPDAGIWETGNAWSLPDWQRIFGAVTREAAGEYMRLHGRLSPETAAAEFPQIRMRAASRVRAMELSSPSALAPAMSASDVRIEASRQPYTRFFALREDDLSFPRFDGKHSRMITRASFLSGDAVTVLPYDPRRDAVLVVRQFRHGPFARGDTNPWTLEPAAGRIDPGESPEEAAKRELFEETGLRADVLHHVGDYYPSPGACSEFLVSFVAIADLSERDGATAGLEEEEEDIMSHVIAFEDLMTLVETGAANTGPLILSAFWLARHRELLRPSD